MPPSSASRRLRRNIRGELIIDCPHRLAGLEVKIPIRWGTLPSDPKGSVVLHRLRRDRPVLHIICMKVNRNTLKQHLFRILDLLGDFDWIDRALRGIGVVRLGLVNIHRYDLVRRRGGAPRLGGDIDRTCIFVLVLE